MEMGEVTRISKHHSERAQGRKAWSGRRRHPAGVKGPPWKPAGEGSARAESPGARRAAAPDVSPLRSDRETDEERMSPQLREHQAGVGNWQVGQGWGLVQNNSGKKGIQNQRTPRLGEISVVVIMQFLNRIVKTKFQVIVHCIFSSSQSSIS